MPWIHKIGRHKLSAQFKLSKRKRKKLVAIFTWLGNERRVSFGAAGMDHYFDRTGLLPARLNHGDSMRRNAWKKRIAGIKRQGKPAYLNPLSPAYWSWNVLW